MNSYFRPAFGATIATLIGLTILIGLGAWQIERLHWKLNLVATINQRIADPAIEAPAQSEWANLDLKALEYHHLKVTGRFNNAQELHYFTQNNDGDPGFDIVTPLTLADGRIILIDRGFVPRDNKEASTRAAGQIEGETTIVGVARAPQSRSLFSATDDPKENMWFTRDPATMAAALNLSNVAPFYIEADATPNVGGLPIGGRTQVTIRNEHLQYAITWFGLAFVLFAVYLSYHWSNGRIGRRKAGEGNRP